MKEERHWQRKTHSDSVCPVTLILADSFKMFPHFHMLLQNWCTLCYLDENDSPLKCTVSISCADYNCERKGVVSNTSAGCLDMYRQELVTLRSVTESHYVIKYADAPLNPLGREKKKYFKFSINERSTLRCSSQRKPVNPVKQPVCTKRLTACWLLYVFEPQLSTVISKEVDTFEWQTFLRKCLTKLSLSVTNTKD